ncbi:2-methylthioadenine synthetase [Eggerthella sp. YY7918]|nr:2-methylthioadenine synthetase [Eggerthella sp. YY7918]
MSCGRPEHCRRRYTVCWIKAYRDNFTYDFWLDAALKEYKFIYGKSIQEEIRVILEKLNVVGTEYEKEAFNQLVLLSNEASIKAVCHFGQHYFNTATRAGLFRVALKELPYHLQNSPLIRSNQSHE